MAHPFPAGDEPVAPLNTSQIQAQILVWQDHNFGTTRDPVTVALGLAEETGEVCRAVLKRAQGIRGTTAEWTDEAAKELGDVFVKMVDLADSLGIDLDEAITARWLNVRRRDFRADSVGHGLPKD